MSKGEGTYVCQLDESTVKKAKEELNEDPTQRASQIEAFRQWVKNQPHLNSRTDDAFLLRFLRVAKFSQLAAQQRLDNFWTVRTSSLDGVPSWFSNMDPLDPKIQEIFDLGMQVPLPGYDDNGRKVILIQTGGYDPKEVYFGDIQRASFMSTDVLLLDERVQVHGICIVLDFGQFGAAHVFNWDRDTIRKASRCWQDVYPTRNKAINYLNTPTLFNALFEIFKLFMKEKTKQRLHFHKDSLDSLHRQVPKRLLPTEYGGDAGPLEKLNQQWKETVVSHRDEIISYNQYGVHEDKRPKPEAQGWGIVGSFRKLAVD